MCYRYSTGELQYILSTRYKEDIECCTQHPVFLRITFCSDMSQSLIDVYSRISHIVNEDRSDQFNTNHGEMGSTENDFNNTSDDGESLVYNVNIEE